MEGKKYLTREEIVEILSSSPLWKETSENDFQSVESPCNYIGVAPDGTLHFTWEDPCGRVHQDFCYCGAFIRCGNRLVAPGLITQRIKI